MLEACKIYFINLKTRSGLFDKYNMLFTIKHENTSYWHKIQREHLFLVLPGWYYKTCAVLLVFYYIHNSSACHEQFSTKNWPVQEENLAVKPDIFVFQISFFFGLF